MADFSVASFQVVAHHLLDHELQEHLSSFINVGVDYD